MHAAVAKGKSRARGVAAAKAIDTLYARTVLQQDFLGEANVVPIVTDQRGVVVGGVFPSRFIVVKVN